MNLDNARHLVFWLAGFVVLFVFNVVVEFFVLPMLDLDNTPANDPYFMSWWLVVLLWLIFGWKVVGHLLHKHQP